MDTSALAKREIPIFKREGRDYIDRLEVLKIEMV